MFLATPLGCKPAKWFNFLLPLAFIGFSVKPCKYHEEVSEQDGSEEIFHLLAILGKRFHTWVFTDWKFRIFEQLINNSVTGNFPAKKLSLAGLKCNGRISARPHVSFQTGLEQKSDKWSKLSDLFLNWSAFIKVWLIRNECNSESMNKLAFFNTFV